MGWGDGKLIREEHRVETAWGDIKLAREKHHGAISSYRRNSTQKGDVRLTGEECHIEMRWGKESVKSLYIHSSSLLE